MARKTGKTWPERQVNMARKTGNTWPERQVKHGQKDEWCALALFNCYYRISEHPLVLPVRPFEIEF